MQSRTQYLIFLTIWLGAMIILFIFAVAFGFDLGGDIDTTLILSGILASIPAAVGYVLVLKLRSLMDRWRIKRGRDVYRNRQFEDDSGFIHLNEVAISDRQEEIGLGEMVSNMKPMLDDLTEDSNDS